MQVDAILHYHVDKCMRNAGSDEYSQGKPRSLVHNCNLLHWEFPSDIMVSSIKEDEAKRSKKIMT